MPCVLKILFIQRGKIHNIRSHDVLIVCLPWNFEWCERSQVWEDWMLHTGAIVYSISTPLMGGFLDRRIHSVNVWKIISFSQMNDSWAVAIIASRDGSLQEVEKIGSAVLVKPIAGWCQILYFRIARVLMNPIIINKASSIYYGIKNDWCAIEMSWFIMMVRFMRDRQ